MTAWDSVTAHPFCGNDATELAELINALSNSKEWGSAITVVPLGVDPGTPGYAGEIQALIMVGKLAAVPVPSMLP